MFRTIHINYESLFLAYFIPVNRSRRKPTAVQPGNEAIVWKRGRDAFLGEKRLAAKAALPFTDSCSRAFIKLGSTSTYTSPLRVLLMFREGEVERSKDRRCRVHGWPPHVAKRLFRVVFPTTDEMQASLRIHSSVCPFVAPRPPSPRLERHISFPASRFHCFLFTTAENLINDANKQNKASNRDEDGGKVGHQRENSTLPIREFLSETGELSRVARRRKADNVSCIITT